MTPEFTINANSDLDALVRDFRADQAELARREQLINGEAYRRTYETHRASEEKVKEQIEAIKKKRRDEHTELVRRYRAAKDVLAPLDAAVARAQKRVQAACYALENAQFQVQAHHPINPDDRPLPEEIAVWNDTHNKLRAAVVPAGQAYSEALAALKPIQFDRDTAAAALHELAAMELAARNEMQGADHLGHWQF